MILTSKRSFEIRNSKFEIRNSRLRIAILNAGGQADYLYGLVSGLAGVPDLEIEVIDGDKSAGLFDKFKNVTFYNLRGNQDPNSNLLSKMWRILLYYLRLVRHAARSTAGVFHIQWENKFPFFDRTLLIWYYRFLGKKLVFTAHNINAQLRNGRSSRINHFTLEHMYRRVDRIIVHTPKMARDLCRRFGIMHEKISIIPHGINNRVQRKAVTRAQAREKLQIQEARRVILFFGYLDLYKGVDILVEAFRMLSRDNAGYFLIIAGWPGRCPDYATEIVERLHQYGLRDSTLLRLEFIPDDDVEHYFMASDCLVLPYRYIDQSGVLFLAYTFGLPVIATDVGSFREEIDEGVTGFVCEPHDAQALAETLRKYFTSDLYKALPAKRQVIESAAKAKYDWTRIGRLTARLYADLANGETV